MKIKQTLSWLKAAVVAAIVMGGGSTALAWSPPPWEFEFDQSQQNTGADGELEQSGADDVETPGKYRLSRVEENFLDETRYSYQESKDAEKAYDSLGSYGYLSDDEEVMFWRAWYASKAGKIAEAEGLYRALIARDPENPWNYNALGYLLASNNFERLPDAAELLEKAWEIAPNEPAIIHSLGYLFQRGGQEESAGSHYVKALKLLGRRYEEEPFLHYAIYLARYDSWYFERWKENTQGLRGSEGALYLQSDEFNERLEEEQRHYDDLPSSYFNFIFNFAQKMSEKKQAAEEADSNEAKPEPQQ